MDSILGRMKCSAARGNLPWEMFLVNMPCFMSNRFDYLCLHELGNGHLLLHWSNNGQGRFYLMDLHTLVYGDCGQAEMFINDGSTRCRHAGIGILTVKQIQQKMEVAYHLESLL